MLDRIDALLTEWNFQDEPIRMYLAGGMALHYHCGSRYTQDVDASFSRKIMLPANDLLVDYLKKDGTPGTLYFDANYNDSFSSMHPDYKEDSLPWQGIGNEKRQIHLHVLTPLDLAVSKISRFSDQDHEDILALAKQKFFTSHDLVHRAQEALDYYVGDPRWIKLTISRLKEEIEKIQEE